MAIRATSKIVNIEPFEHDDTLDLYRWLENG